MKFDEIFNINENEYFDSVRGMRYSISLDDCCRIYKYDKKVGVNLNVFVDHLESDTYVPENYHIVTKYDIKDNPDLVPGKLYVRLDVSCWNNDTNSYDEVATMVNLELQRKKNSKLELMLDPAHFDDESKVKIKLKHTIYFADVIYSGFLGMKQSFKKLCLTNFKEISLSSQILYPRNCSKTRNLNFDPFEEF